MRCLLTDCRAWKGDGSVSFVIIVMEGVVNIGRRPYYEGLLTVGG